jgi:hypothetical protein
LTSAAPNDEREAAARHERSDEREHADDPAAKR